MSIAMVRVVSDGVDGDIPDLTQAIDEEGGLNSVKMAIAFLMSYYTQPSSNSQSIDILRQ